ncbi:MAG: hypothetical protein J6J35_01440 [Alphaproteobacteria bacterium]|nr:hypothetical protein [Alphaproteobacteria bacterium]
MSSSQNNADANRNTGGYIGELEANLGLDDAFNNLFAGFGSSSATANSGLSTGNWGTHSSSINIDSPTMSLSKMITFCGVALIGYWLFKKIARK